MVSCPSNNQSLHYSFESTNAPEQGIAGKGAQKSRLVIQMGDGPTQKTVKVAAVEFTKAGFWDKIKLFLGLSFKVTVPLKNQSDQQTQNNQTTQQTDVLINTNSIFTRLMIGKKDEFTEDKIKQRLQLYSSNDLERAQAFDALRKELDLNVKITDLQLNELQHEIKTDVDSSKKVLTSNINNLRPENNENGPTDT
jgi:hypothetical protein